ncbi:MAG: voltage-gated potassium channel [Kiritimatiellia bacterium]|jgi:voltage-gated potassium channel
MEDNGDGGETLRLRVYRQLTPAARLEPGLSTSNKLICVLIVCSVSTAILETEASLVSSTGALFLYLEWGFTIIFSLEYVARLWVQAENPKFSDGIAGKLRYARTPAALLDLLAIAPVLVTLGGADAYFLRLFRLLRVLRLARLGRFSEAMGHIAVALRSRCFELFLSICAAVILLIFSATLLYLVEGETQKEAFGSIPRAMWWAMATLTTVGYGDVFPVTLLGRVFASLTAIAGVAMVAMPAGIFAAAFSDAMQEHKAKQVGPDQTPDA